MVVCDLRTGITSVYARIRRIGIQILILVGRRASGVYGAKPPDNQLRDLPISYRHSSTPAMTGHKAVGQIRLAAITQDSEQTLRTRDVADALVVVCISAPKSLADTMPAHVSRMRIAVKRSTTSRVMPRSFNQSPNFRIDLAAVSEWSFVTRRACRIDNLGVTD